MTEHVTKEQKEVETLHKKEHELVGKAVRYYAKASSDTPHAGIITSAKYDPDSDAVTVNLAVYEESGVSVNKPGVTFVTKGGEKKAHEELDQFCVAV